jgi:hypothetical protein
MPVPLMSGYFCGLLTFTFTGSGFFRVCCLYVCLAIVLTSCLMVASNFCNVFFVDIL